MAKGNQPIRRYRFFVFYFQQSDYSTLSFPLFLYNFISSFGCGYCAANRWFFLSFLEKTIKDRSGGRYIDAEHDSVDVDNVFRIYYFIIIILLARCLAGDRGQLGEDDWA